MVQLQSQPADPTLITNAWSNATWEQFLQTTEDPALVKAKAYYFNGQMRFEMGTGPDHAADNGIIYAAILLFCALKQIPIKGLINCSYRKPGVCEVQPHISCYVGDQAKTPPKGSSVVDLDQHSPPNLAIEIADSSLSDDLGKKRLLYEDLNIAEYWVVNVENPQILAFQVIKDGSQRISESQVLPGLSIAVLQTALEQIRQMDDSQVVAWLMTQFQTD